MAIIHTQLASQLHLSSITVCYITCTMLRNSPPLVGACQWCEAYHISDGWRETSTG